MERQAKVKCEISQGMFPSERVAKITLPDGRKIFAIVDKEFVESEAEPSLDKYVNGKLKVSIIGEEEEEVWINMPGQGFANGSRIKIPKSFLEMEK